MWEQSEELDQRVWWQMRSGQFLPDHLRELSETDLVYMAGFRDVESQQHERDPDDRGPARLNANGMRAKDELDRRMSERALAVAERTARWTRLMALFTFIAAGAAAATAIFTAWN